MKKKQLKKIVLNVLCVFFAGATLIALIWGLSHGMNAVRSGYEDGIRQIDLNTIYLTDSKVEVSFSDVIVSRQQEMRKLIVSEQTGTVSTELTDRLINKIDFDFMKKTQKVTYTGKGFFVVDLDNLNADRIVDDKKSRIVTIFIDHAYLQAIEINPNDILIDEVKEGLLARGDIELSLKDYKEIEKELRTRLEKEFNTAENGQEADELALKMVKEVYEPIIRAIDGRYTVQVAFH